MNARTVVGIITSHPNEFTLGVLEWAHSTGVTYDNNPESDRSQAYDLGRTLGEALNLATDEYCDHIYESYCPKCGIDSAEELA